MTYTVKGMGRGIQTQEGVCAQEPLWYAGNGGYRHKVGLHPRKVVEGAHIRGIFMQRTGWESCTGNMSTEGTMWYEEY